MNKSINEMKQELLNLDHDCRNFDPDDGCRVCCWLDEASDDEIREKHLEFETELNPTLEV